MPHVFVSAIVDDTVRHSLRPGGGGVHGGDLGGARGREEEGGQGSCQNGQVEGRPRGETPPRGAGPGGCQRVSRTGREGKRTEGLLVCCSALLG